MARAVTHLSCGRSPRRWPINGANALDLGLARVIVPIAAKAHHRAHIAPVARLLGIDGAHVQASSRAR